MGTVPAWCARVCSKVPFLQQLLDEMFLLSAVRPNTPGRRRQIIALFSIDLFAAVHPPHCPYATPFVCQHGGCLGMAREYGNSEDDNEGDNRYMAPELLMDSNKHPVRMQVFIHSLWFGASLLR